MMHGIKNQWIRSQNVESSLHEQTSESVSKTDCLLPVALEIEPQSPCGMGILVRHTSVERL